MTKTCPIDLRALAAIAIAADNEETRYYLEGVCVEVAPETVTYVATDGHIMAATRREQVGECDNPLVGSFIIPTEVCKHFKVSKKENGEATLSQGDGTSLTLSYAGKAIMFEPIDGTFPAWRRVVPHTFSGEVAQFDPALLARLSKAGKALGDDGRLSIAHNGGSPALVSFGHADPNAFGVVMPFRASDARLPPWLREERAPLAQAAE